MKAYETMRFRDCPDQGDIMAEARKSSVGRYPEAGGDYKSYTRSAKARRWTRRLLKRLDKIRARRLIEADYENEYEID